MDGVSVRAVALLQLEAEATTLGSEIEQALNDCGSGIDSGKRVTVADLKRRQSAIRNDIAELRAEIEAMKNGRDSVGIGCVVTMKRGEKRQQYAIMRIASGVRVEKDGEQVIVLQHTNAVATKLLYKKVGDRLLMTIRGEGEYWTIDKID